MAKEEAKPNCYLQDYLQDEDADEVAQQSWEDEERLLREITEGMQEEEFDEVKVEVKVEDTSGELIEETEELLQEAEDVLEADRVSECSDEEELATSPWRQRKFRPGDGYYAVQGFKFPPPHRSEDAPPVAQKSRSAFDRRKFREQHEQASQWANLDEEAKWAGENDVPWDLRGPLRGPKEGGPDRWKNQKFRENKQVWANSAGQNKTRYNLYYIKKNQGKLGKELHWYHPLNQNGKYAGDVIEPVAA